MHVETGTTTKRTPNRPLSELTVLPADASLDPVSHAKIDALEQRMLTDVELVDAPLIHLFTPGLYTRTIYMDAGTVFVSKLHKTEHPFVILQGSVSVFTPGKPVEHLCAPYLGVTHPGTRRVLIIHEDTIWATFHTNPDDERDVDVIEDRIIEHRLLPDGTSVYDKYVAAIDRAEIESALDLPGLDEYQGAP